MLNIKINGKVYGVPTSFREITLADYCRCFTGLEKTDGFEGRELFMATKRNEVAVISRLLGEKDDFVMDLPLDFFSVIQQATSFIFGIEGLGHKTSIEVDGKVYRVAQPKEMNLRQWIDLDMTMEEDVEGRFVDLLSMLLMETDDEGKLKPYKGFDEEFAKKLANVRADEGLGIVYRFFLLGAISSRLSEAYSKVEEVANLSRRPTRSS